MLIAILKHFFPYHDEGNPFAKSLVRDIKHAKRKKVYRPWSQKKKSNLPNYATTFIHLLKFLLLEINECKVNAPSTPQIEPAFATCARLRSTDAGSKNNQ